MGFATLINLGRITKGGPAVATDMLANLTSLRDAANNVASEQILSNAITAGKINAGAVTTPKIANGALSADATGRAKMAAGFVNQSLIEALAVGTAQIANEAVTVDKMGAGLMLQMFAGSYVGNGSTTGPVITGFGFQPKFVISGIAAEDPLYMGFDGDGATAGFMNARRSNGGAGISGPDAYEITADGFDIKHAVTPNISGKTYYFFALGLNN